jgi:hypothetical protein
MYKIRYRVGVEDTDPISIIIYPVYNMYTLTVQPHLDHDLNLSLHLGLDAFWGRSY